MLRLLGQTLSPKTITEYCINVLPNTQDFFQTLGQNVHKNDKSVDILYSLSTRLFAQSSFLLRSKNFKLHFCEFSS